MTEAEEKDQFTRLFITTAITADGAYYDVPIEQTDKDKYSPFSGIIVYNFDATAKLYVWLNGRRLFVIPPNNYLGIEDLSYSDVRIQPSGGAVAAGSIMVTVMRAFQNRRIIDKLTRIARFIEERFGHA